MELNLKNSAKIVGIAVAIAVAYKLLVEPVADGIKGMFAKVGSGDTTAAS